LVDKKKLNVILLLVFFFNSCTGILSIQAFQGARASEGYRTISSYGTVRSSASGYVYVQDGKFYESDGTPIRFFGVNYLELYPLYQARYDAPTEISVKKMAEYGINFMRLVLNWRCLEPTNDHWNSSYISLIDQVVEWCQKYGIYVMFDIHAGTNAGTPYFISNLWNIWNSTGTSELSEVWGYLANRYAANTAVIGYDLPWNEPWWRKDDISDLESYFKTNWNSWLKKKYGTLEKLNNTWRYDALHDCYLDSDESSWSEVKMLQERGLAYKNNARFYDWQQWFGDLYNNITEQCIENIIAYDVNHLLGISFYVPPEQIRHAYQVHWKVPEPIDFVTDHIYIHNVGWANSVATSLSSSAYSFASYWQVNRSLPVIIGEFGQVTYPSNVDIYPFALASAMNFLADTNVQGVCIWCWCRYYQWGEYSIVDQNYNLWTIPDMTWVPYIAKAFRGETATKYKPKVAIVQGINTGPVWHLAIGEMLWQLHVPYRVLSDDYVAKNASALEPYDAVIAFSSKFNITAAKNIKKWCEAESNYVLWLGGSGYYSCRNIPAWRTEGRYLYYEIGLTDTETKGSGDPIGEGAEYNLTAETDWGDWKSGESFNFTTGYMECWHPARSDFDGLYGTTVLKRADTTDSIALYYVGRQAVFFSHGCHDSSYHYSKDRSDFRDIIASFLTWAGVNHMSHDSVESVTVRHYDVILVLYEWNQTAGSKTITVNELQPGTYLLYDVVKGTCIARTHSEFASGIIVDMNANGYIIYTLKPTAEPTLIDYDTNARIKNETYNNGKLVIRIVGSPIEVQLKIYCSNKGEPTQVTQDGNTFTSWSYDELNKILTTNFIPSGESDIEVSWSVS